MTFLPAERNMDVNSSHLLNLSIVL
jgi:hypothetical protein